MHQHDVGSYCRHLSVLEELWSCVTGGWFRTASDVAAELDGEWQAPWLVCQDVFSFPLPAASGCLRTLRDLSAPPVSRHICQVVSMVT